MEQRSCVGLAAASNAMLVGLPTYGPLTATSAMTFATSFPGSSRFSKWLPEKTLAHSRSRDSKEVAKMAAKAQSKCRRSGYEIMRRRKTNKMAAKAEITSQSMDLKTETKISMDTCKSNRNTVN